MKHTCLSAALWLATVVPAHAANAPADPLAFDPQAYTTVHATLDGKPLQLRRYYVSYVARPIQADLEHTVAMGPPPATGSGPGAGPAGAPPPTANASTPLNGVPAPAALARPTDPHAYQSMYIYVPEASYHDAGKAIVLQVNNGGWMASAAQDLVRDGSALSSTSDTDNTGAALKAGYIVVSAGTRSRGLRALGGDWAGKAPAVVVDAKAAIRYLRHNDAVMPGSAERIVITGGSGGGGLSVTVAASGNSPDYYPYLAAIGAAGIDARGHSTLRDDVFATIAYCPINDLGHADLAYEWQYGSVRTAQNTQGGYSDQARQASAVLAGQFPAFLASLRLKRADGTLLDQDGLRSSIVELVRQGVQAAIARGEKIPALGEDFRVVLHMGPPPWTDSPVVKVANDWLQVEHGQVTHIDYANYLRFVARVTPLKGVPAFDNSGVVAQQGPGGESSLFGGPAVAYANFTPYAWNHNRTGGDGSGADDTGLEWAAYTAHAGAELLRQVRLVSPLPYLRGKATVASHWYVRHGLVDRDTSFATQALLYQAVRQNPAVKDLDFRLDWLQGHGGNYDVPEAYAWLAAALAQAGPPR